MYPFASGADVRKNLGVMLRAMELAAAQLRLCTAVGAGGASTANGCWGCVKAENVPPKRAGLPPACFFLSGRR